MKEIKLTRGKVTIVDNEDFDYLNQFKWKAQKATHSWYANRVEYINGKQRILYMHRVIICANKGQIVDHIDMEGLNNQKHNLRICSVSQNAMNRKPLLLKSSKYLGVCRYKNKWRAGLKHEGKQHHLGDYDSEIDAAIAYNSGAKRIHGDFARLNQIL